MDFETATQTFLKLFYFTGLSTFDPKPIKTKLIYLKCFYEYGFCASYSAIIILIVTTQYYNLYRNDDFVRKKITKDTRKPGFIHVTFDCILYLAVAIQTIYSGNEIRKIYNQIQKLNVYIMAKLIFIN